MAVSLEDNRANIDSVLKQIPEMFANNRHGSPVGTAAVKACIEALKPHGGRVLAFMVSFFIFSTGQLVSRRVYLCLHLFIYVLFAGDATHRRFGQADQSRGAGAERRR
jgi:hypothetical protein